MDHYPPGIFAPSASKTGDLTVKVFVSSWPSLPGGGTFSPTTSTLIEGPSEVALVDAQYLKTDVNDLGDLIESTGKNLTTIYITHGHADHYFGIGPLLDRFPGVRCIAVPEVIAYMAETRSFQAQVWEGWFGDACVTPGPLPDPLDGNMFHVDDIPLNVINIGQADISPTTVVHVPSIDTLIAGDAIYNEIHPMLGLSTTEEWQKWLAAIDLIESLSPAVIVAGHKRPESSDDRVQAMVGQTREYITQFRQVVDRASNAEEVVSVMTSRFPGHGNPWTLQYSAASAMTARNRIR